MNGCTQRGVVYNTFSLLKTKVVRPGGAVDCRWSKSQDRIPDRIATLRVEYAITGGMRATKKTPKLLCMVAY